MTHPKNIPSNDMDCENDFCEWTTERPNELSTNIDQLSALEIVTLMNRQDRLLFDSIHSVLPTVAKVVERIATAFLNGGRLFYLGAGTSGRLGVLDASECPPTFRSPPEMVIGLIAGGDSALRTAVEGAEDLGAQAPIDLQPYQLTDRDVLVGIASSGRTPYVLAGMEYAKRQGASVVALTCNPATPMHQIAEFVIDPTVGPEVLSGSTRLKAGTATKMILNMLSTASMIRIGKTYGNYMVDLKASNIKLKQRSLRMLMELTGVNEQRALDLLADCDGEVKTAIVSELIGVQAAQARVLLQKKQGRVRDVLNEFSKSREKGTE